MRYIIEKLNFGKSGGSIISADASLLLFDDQNNSKRLIYNFSANELVVINNGSENLKSIIESIFADMQINLKTEVSAIAPVLEKKDEDYVKTVEPDPIVIERIIDDRKPKTNPPVISNIQVKDETDKTATGVVLVIWDTDVPATSVVLYGLDDKYGSTYSDEELRKTRTSGEPRITDLKSQTEYHFKIQSVDRWGNIAESDDIVFTPF